MCFVSCNSNLLAHMAICFVCAGFGFRDLQRLGELQTELAGSADFCATYLRCQLLLTKVGTPTPKHTMLPFYKNTSLCLTVQSCLVCSVFVPSHSLSTCLFVCLSVLPIVHLSPCRVSCVQCYTLNVVLGQHVNMKIM